MTEDTQQNGGDVTDLAEGYPTLSDVVRGILDEEDLPDAGVNRIEINAFASGDATYRFWIVGQDEPEGGYLNQL